MAAVVVDLTLGVADNGLRAPDIVVLATVAAAEDARSVSLGDAVEGHGELGGVIGQEEIAAVGSKSLQCLDGGVAGKVAGQVLPALLDADAVGHDPAGRLLLAVKVVDGGGRNEHTLARIDVVLLEPLYGILLVGALLVVVGHEHGELRAALLLLVVDEEVDGLSLADHVAIAGLHGVGHVDVGGSLLDEVAVHHLLEVHDVLAVLDDAHARLAGLCGVGPPEGDLTAAVLEVGHEVAHTLLGL